MAAIKGGFPVDQRKENAVQLRLSKNLFDFLSQNAKGLIDLVLPGGEIAVPSTCAGDAQICCGQMCKLKAEFASLNFTPAPPSTTRFVLRTKLRTLTDMKVKYKSGIINLNCNMSIDSTRSGKGDIGITAALASAVDAQTRLTNLDVDDNSVDILDLDSGDIKLSGDIGCFLADLLKGALIGTLKDQIKKQLAGPIEDAFCQKCTTKDDCSSLATDGCSAKKQCARGGKCMQLLGVEGSLDLGGLISSAKGASLDIYAVAGGYAAVEPTSGGMSLGMLGGARARPPSSCVPERAAPTTAAPPKSAALAGNTAPNGKAFHVGAGVSTAELDLFGYGFYQSGGLCLSLGSPDVALLNSGTLTTLVRSLDDITRGQPASVYIVMRPQQAPQFTLGKGTFKMDMGKKVIDDPLLRIGAKDFAIDFYLYMDERYTRFMRLTADMNIPIGLDVDNLGQLVPLLGDLGAALGNIRVTDTQLLKEDPQTLAVLFPKLLPLLLGQVAGSLKPIALPKIMNFVLKPVQLTSLEGEAGKLQLLGLFFELGISTMFAPPETGAQSVAPPIASFHGSPAETTARLVRVQVPTASRFAIGPRHDPATRVTLHVDGQGSGSLEYQYAVDGGLWHIFDDQHELTVDDAGLGLAGPHYIDVRARVVGEPGSLDPTPARVSFVVAPTADSDSGELNGFHGRTGEGGGGCACSVAGGRGEGSGGPGAFGLSVFGLGLGLLLRRRGAAAAKAGARGAVRSGALLVPLALCAASASGVTACSGDPEGTDVAPGENFRDDDEIGRYQSAVAKGKLIFVSAYNSTWGDLAYAEISDPAEKLVWRVVDGLPEGPPTDPMPGAPRRGQTDAGSDVGRFTSIALTSGNVPMIAYQDSTAGAVRLATGPAGEWKISSIDEPADGVKLGMFTQMSLDDSDVPTVAYMAQGVRKDGGKVAAQLIVATASSKSPTGPADWSKKIVEEVEIPCAGWCSKSEACVAVGAAMDPQPSVCKATSTCMTACGTGKACVANACVDVLAPLPADIPEGTGLYARLLRGGGALHVVYHDRQKGALKMASAPDFAVKTIDGGDGKIDVGQHLGAALAEDGTVHVAYVDAVGDRLLFRSVKDGTAAMTEVVDDGARGTGAGRERHAVGAGALVFLDEGTPKVAYQDQTGNTLEIATRASAWTHESRAAGPMRARGFYPQAVRLDGKWLILDVVYDRGRDAPLSAVEFSPL